MTVGPDCLINFASTPTPNKGQRYCTKQKSLFCKYDCIVTFQLERKKMYKMYIKYILVFVIVGLKNPDPFDKKLYLAT